MKRTTTLLHILAFFGSLHLALANPSITTQPASRTNNVGDNAQFAVTATGSGTLTYQWKLNAVDVSGGTASTLNVLVTDSSKAGTYTVAVTDVNGPTPSSDAVLSVPYGDAIKIAQWNFNSATPDNNTGTGSTTPSYGSGTYSLYGTFTTDFNTGSSSDPAASDNSGWRSGSWGTANKSRGVQFSVSTVGYKDIVVTWERKPNTGVSKYCRLQYTLNGTDWTDYTVDTATVAGSFFFRSSELSGISGANNNPQFAFRLTPEWESTAIGSGTAGFVGIGGTYSSTANMLFDMITVLGSVYTPPDQAPQISVQPQNQTNYTGVDVTFSVVVTGGHLGYQWRLNGDPIAGGTGSSLVVTNIDAGDEGNYLVFITNSVDTITSDNAYLAVLAPPPAGDRYWSGDGVTLGGLGTWNTTSQRWGTSVAGPFGLAWNNANWDTAYFNAPAATVTIGEPIVVNKINVVGNANYTFSGTSMLTFTNDATLDCTSTASSAAVSLTCPLAAQTLAKTGAGRMHLNNTGNNVNKFVVTGGCISVQNGSSLGTTPADLVPDRLTLDGAGLGFEGVAPSLSATRGITLGAGGGKLGIRSGGVTCTINAPITGTGGLSFPTFNGFHGSGIYGANELYVLNSTSNNYAGGTTISVSEVRLGASEVLPDTTTLTLAGGNTTATRGRLNLNGKTETVGNVITSGAGAAIFGAGTLVATNYDLRQSRTGGGTNGIMSVLAGNANLTKTTTGDLELGGANTYTGETFLTAGNTFLDSPGRFGNGAGALHLDGGNIALNDTRTEATILLNPVVMTNLVEAEIKSSITATGAVVCLSGGAWAVEQGTIYLLNPSSDPTSTFTLALTNTAQFAAAAQLSTLSASVGLSSLNPAGTEQTFDCMISGPGSFRRSVLSGAGGRTIFTAANDYSGGTVIDAGTLLVNNTFGSGTGSGDVTVGAPSGVLGGTGIISGPVTVAIGGTIAAGSSAGVLTLQNGLSLSGTNIWELAALADDSNGAAGTDFDQLVLTGGDLVLGGSCRLVLQFGVGQVPNSAVPFWQSPRSWTIVRLNGGNNPANATFASVVNGSYNAGNFSTAVSGGGNVVLNFTPNPPSAPHVTLNPLSRTNVVGTTASFTVAATGSDPLGYVWYRLDAPFTPISGATNATYVIPNVQFAQAGDYFARVTNSLGNDVSQTAKLTVVARPQMQAPSGAGTASVVLTWPAVPDTSYQVQYNTNLATANWYVLTNVVANGSSLSVTDHPSVAGPKRFYRLLIQ